jgi:hypothetical protein
MLKWKTQPIVISVAGTEVTSDVLGFQQGKNRRIKFMSGPITASLWLRAYRTAEQCVDFDTALLNTGMTLLPVDIPLKEGDTFKAGFIDKGAGAATYNVTIGYEESD